MIRQLDDIRQQFIETAGNTTQSLGHGRTLGQIFGFLYLSQKPQTLDNFTSQLGVSKGGASMAIRQLEQWGAVKRVWIKGDRKDYYEACDDFGSIVRKAAIDTVGSRMRTLDEVICGLDQRLKELKADNQDEKQQLKYYQRRLRTLAVFRDRAKWIWDRSILKLLIKR